tara:strand:- start:386 stop:1018 length:633 start_codon:yes stop_codon:yes gene_type:complete
MRIKLLNGKKTLHFNIPKTWNELNLGRYIRIMKVLRSEEKVHELEKIIRILNCITDIPKKDLYGLDMKSIGKLGTHLTRFLESVPDDELKHFITIEGIEYGFHPKLVDMSLGEFVDLETYVENQEENLHLILSILYRPVTAKKNEKYRIEDYEPSEDRADLFKKHLTVGDFYGASVFFYDLGTQLSINSKKSLIQELKNKKKKRTLMKTD